MRQHTSFGAWISSVAFTAVAGAAIGLAACSEPAGLETQAPPVAADHIVDGAQDGHFILCKEGTDADFTVSVDGATGPVSLADGERTEVARVEPIPDQPSPSKTVTVTETSRPSTSRAVR